MDTLQNMADNAAQAAASALGSVLPVLGKRFPDAQVWRDEFHFADGDRLEPSQQEAYDQIIAQTSGITLLTGGPGSGKVRTSQWVGRALFPVGRELYKRA